MGNADLKELALEVTTDPDHKFDLSLQLDDLDAALEITRSIPEQEAVGKWKALGDRALAVWRFDLAREAFDKAGDLSALMLLLLATGDRTGLASLATKAGARWIFLIDETEAKACVRARRGKGAEQPRVRDALPAWRCQVVHGPADQDPAGARGCALCTHICTKVRALPPLLSLEY